MALLEGRSSEDEELDDDEFIEKIRSQEASREKGIHEIFEPDELQKRFYTDKDKKIRMTDCPERFQLRRIPVAPAGNLDQPDNQELRNESRWILMEAFYNHNISDQRTNKQKEKQRIDRMTENQVVMQND